MRQKTKVMGPAGEATVIVGSFHEVPDGRIVKTFGWTGRDQQVKYYFDDGQYGRIASLDEYLTWKHRPDLDDFPNARDPLLPYEFDLWLDIKHTSELRRLLGEGGGDREKALELMERHGVVMPDIPEVTLPAEDEDYDRGGGIPGLGR